MPGRLRGGAALLGCLLSGLVWEGSAGQPRSARAQGSRPLFDEVYALLESGWKTSASSLAAAQPHYEAAQRVAPDDPRVAYAMALVALKSHKYDEALKLLVPAPRQPVYLPARQARLWALVVTKQYPAALVEMEALARTLNELQADEAQQAAATQSAQFLGRLQGVMSSPLADAVPAEQLAATREAVQAALSSSQRLAFAAGSQAAAADFARLEGELQATRQQVLEEQMAEKAAEAQRLVEERQAVAQGRSAVQQRGTAADSTYRQEEADINRQATPLRTQYDRLVSRAQVLANILADASRRIDALLFQASRERDRNRALALQAEADRIRFTFRLEDAELSRVQGELARVQQELTRLANLLAAAQARYQAVLEQLKAETARLNKQEKSIEVRQKEVEEPAKGNSPKVTSQASRLKALSTYVELPLEAEKARLLSELRGG